MSGRDNTGWKRGAGAYSKDYAKFDRSTTEYSAKSNADLLNVGDYDSKAAFTGEVSRSSNHPSQGRYSKKGDGAYSPTRDSGVGKGSGKQGKSIGGQKVSD